MWYNFVFQCMHKVLIDVIKLTKCFHVCISPLRKSSMFIVISLWALTSTLSLDTSSFALQVSHYELGAGDSWTLGKWQSEVEATCVYFWSPSRLDTTQWHCGTQQNLQFTSLRFLLQFPCFFCKNTKCPWWKSD